MAGRIRLAAQRAAASASLSSSLDPRLTRTLFASVLAEARALDKAFRQRGDQVDVQKELVRIERYLQRPLSVELRDGELPSAQAVATRAFRRELAGGNADAGTLDVAFAAIRRLSVRRTQLCRADWRPKPAHVLLNVGQIFRHKRWGFRGARFPRRVSGSDSVVCSSCSSPVPARLAPRVPLCTGVVIDWHPRCPAQKDWISQFGPFEQGLEQPFYKTLVCTLDRPRPFMALAAGENLVAVAPGSKDAATPVEHPLMGRIFDENAFRDDVGMHMVDPAHWETFSEDF